jgi:2-oxoglutarate ferredoxin oxidoreductase subunit alpha
MVNLRDQKIKNIANDIPDLEVKGEQEGELLVLGWGSTYGAITAAVHKIEARGLKVSHAHLKYINPFPKNLGDVLKRFKKVLLPEINLGQLSQILRNQYLIELVQFNKVQGLPIKASEIEEQILNIIGGKNE